MIPTQPCPTRNAPTPSGTRRALHWRVGRRVSPMLFSALLHGIGLTCLAATLVAVPPPAPPATILVAAAADDEPLEPSPEIVEPDLTPLPRPELEEEPETLEEPDPEWSQDVIETPGDREPDAFAARVTIGLGGRARRGGRSRAAPEPQAPVAPALAPLPSVGEPVRIALEPDRVPLALATNQAPPYPRIARTRGWTGAVRLRIDVDAEGSVAAVSIQKSSGYAVLDRAAVDAARAWRFEPATRSGEPAAGVVLQTVRFVL